MLPIQYNTIQYNTQSPVLRDSAKVAIRMYYNGVVEAGDRPPVEQPQDQHGCRGLSGGTIRISIMRRVARDLGQVVGIARTQLHGGVCVTVREAPGAVPNTVLSGFPVGRAR